MKKILIIDTSAVINDFITEYSSYRLITSAKVMKELKSHSETKDLEERVPTPELIKFVSMIDKDLSDKTSEADKELLALAIEFRAPVVTDDYGIQNIAKQLGIKFIPVVQPGITKIISWQYYCSGCRKKYDKSGTCNVCGSRIKRKART